MAAARNNYQKGFGLMAVIVGLLILKLGLVGFSLGNIHLSDLYRPSAAVAQEKKDETPAEKSEQTTAPKVETKGETVVAPTKAKTAQLSPAQLEIMRSVERTKHRLDAWEKELEQKQRQLELLQAEMDEKIAKLEALRQEFVAQVTAEETRQNERIKHLVTLYSNMKPQAAAAVIEELDDVIAVEIFRNMRGREAGKILAYVSPALASRISEMLSGTLAGRE